MPINPQHYGTITFSDYSNESSSMSFNHGPITALTIAAFLTQFGALRAATEDIVLGTLKQDQWVGDQTRYNNAPPTDPAAQRERKFLVSYEGTTTFSRYRLEIPTADLTGRVLPDTDLIDLTDPDIAAWITAFETLCQTPEGEPVNVLEIRHVGRNI